MLLYLSNTSCTDAKLVVNAEDPPPPPSPPSTPQGQSAHGGNAEVEATRDDLVQCEIMSQENVETGTFNVAISLY